MKAWYHPSDEAWLFARLPDWARDAFTWEPSARLVPGHIWAEDDRDGSLKRFTLPSAPPMRPWDSAPLNNPFTPKA